ncbi:MAG: TRAP transporter large permease subunit [Dehalococcoidales bacterium]|nr:TRAP transporter large permease subunit [Dehalococcoidales bacterium]
MTITVLTIILFGLMVLLLALGLPVAFAMGGAAVMFGIATRGFDSLFLMFVAVLTNIKTIILIAIPMFILMGNILEVSGLAEDLFKFAQNWLGRIRGGLAIAAVIVCTIFAACTGVSAAATVTMGLIALPAMLRRGYNARLAMGCIMGGGALGILIPPSVSFVLYGFMAQESVGRLFAGGIIPGFILSSLFIAYVMVVCYVNPKMGPALPKELRVSWSEKFASVKSIILPAMLVVFVLGSIFSGFATPTEASAVGAAGAVICALIYRRFTWKSMMDALSRSLSLTAMVMWIVVGATAFTTIFTRAGAMELIKNGLMNLEIPPIMIILIMQLVLFILGMFMDVSGIILLCTPLFVPVVKALGFSTVWFGVLFIINMEMGFLSPPYGINLFYMRGVATREITMTDIYMAALPFIVIQAIALFLTLFIPGLATWIPNMIFGPEL